MKNQLLQSLTLSIEYFMARVLHKCKYSQKVKNLSSKAFGIEIRIQGSEEKIKSVNGSQ